MDFIITFFKEILEVLKFEKKVIVEFIDDDLLIDLCSEDSK